jgi:hypothetical protein
LLCANAFVVVQTARNHRPNLSGRNVPSNQCRRPPNSFSGAFWIHRELTDKQSRGFGSLAAHQLLTLAQLDDLQKRQPGLLGNQAFVSAKLLRLRPNAEVDMVANRTEWTVDLIQVEAFTRKLPSAFRSLRAATLYHLLDAQRARGSTTRS